MDVSGGERIASGSGRASVDAFLEALGSDRPAPGGGAAAALGGALAAALVAMVGRVTAAREPSERDEMSEIASRADQLRHRLAGLVDEDMDAYLRVLQARAKAPAGPDVERALRGATEVPLHVTRASRDVLALCEQIVPRARLSAVSDLGVAAALGGGALESGALIARVNLNELADAAFVRDSEREIEGLLAEGDGLRRRICDMIASRMQRRG